MSLPLESLPLEIVVASQDLEIRSALTRILTQLGFDPICTTTIRQCREVLEKAAVGLVFCDRNLTDGDYRDLLSTVIPGTRNVPVVLLTHASAEYQEARQLGAFDAISTPCRPTDVEWMVIQARRSTLVQKSA